LEGLQGVIERPKQRIDTRKGDNDEEDEENNRGNFF
jgi:hypothetical protein